MIINYKPENKKYFQYATFEYGKKSQNFIRVKSYQLIIFY